jgi:Putative transposase DNA-binding domain
MLRACSIKTKVLRLRIKDKHAKFLRHLADEVNFVWNYCNELQLTMFNRERRFLSGFGWRNSTGSRRSLGWIPFKKAAIQIAHGQIKFAGQWLSLWDSYGLDAYPSALAKTRHAKSVLDAGWSAFRTMLRYKCDFAVDEAFSTQTCSVCDSRSGPKGIAGLGIRVWTCSECRTVHDRNVNAAKIILAAGRRRLAEGIPAPQGVGGRQIQYPCSIEQQ